MPDNPWRRKAEALARLAADQKGKPEGDVAASKLAEILAKHPEARGGHIGPIPRAGNMPRTMSTNGTVTITINGMWVYSSQVKDIRVDDA